MSFSSPGLSFDVKDRAGKIDMCSGKEYRGVSDQDDDGYNSLLGLLRLLLYRDLSDRS